MRTVIFQNIDGHKIVLGFDRQYKNPRAIQKSIQKELENTPEFKAWKNAINQIESVKPVDKRDVVGMRRFTEQMSEAINEATKAKRAMDDKHRQISKKDAHVIYFPLEENQEVLSGEEEYHALYDQLRRCPAEKLLKRDGTIIENNKGKAFYRVVDGLAEEIIIEKIGESAPENFSQYQELNEHEKNSVQAMRKRKKISEMSSDEKSLEMEKEIRILSQIIARDLTMAEIEGGDRNSLVNESRSRFSEESQKIREMYENA